MYYRVTVYPIGRVVDRTEQDLILQAQSLGITSLESVRSQTLYFLQGDLTPAHIERLCNELLVDPVLQTAEWEAVTDHGPASQKSGLTWALEIGLHPGVTDPVANQIITTARLFDIHDIQVATGQRYELGGVLSQPDVHTIARRLLCNETIQHYYLGPMKPAFAEATKADGRAERIVLADLSNEQLLALSRQRLLALNQIEMRAIQSYFTSQRRDPSDVELETLAQTWSEHCVHKTFKARISYQEAGKPIRQIDGLLFTYIRAATEAAAKPWVRSAFVDNAGIIDFDDVNEVSFKVETHNHPSALEPFGGANTGVGGVVRDVIGVSARPIACSDVFCFGPQDLPLDDVPQGSLHPQRIQSGVVAGVEDYGNKLGLPTLSGAVFYDEGYTANPLVYVGCVGMAPKGSHPTRPGAGDLVVLLGGRTGRDGLHGATFSSESLTHETGEIAGTAVQIGDPITEKDVMEVVCQARDAQLYTAITDCGAGGLSSAVGELGKRLGVEVELSRVPLKYPGLQPWEIWLSEAQERMVLAVPPANWPALHHFCRAWNVEATPIGEFTESGRLTVRYETEIVADLAMDFLHEGLPRWHLAAIWEPQEREDHPNSSFDQNDDLNEVLLKLLSHPNIASKEEIIRRYDHEVGAGTVIKPLVGAATAGPSDAVILKPLGTWSHRKALVLSLGLNPEYGKVDPYAMAVSAVDEAIRNAVAVGADPDRIALLDNFCWGNPQRPEQLGRLVRAAQGCYDGAVAYQTPFISGKDSLNNEYIGPDGQPTPIPGTLLISALGIIPDMDLATTMDLKETGNQIFLLGETKPELAGSHYAMVTEFSGSASDPARLPSEALAAYRALHKAMQSGVVRACHDLSEGGLAVSAAEMCLAGRLGMTLHLDALLLSEPNMNAEPRLFSESNGRMLIEVRPEDECEFLKIMLGHPVTKVATVGGDTLKVLDVSGALLIEMSITDIEAAWRGGLA